MDAGHSHIAGIFVYDNYQSVEKVFKAWRKRCEIVVWN